MKALSTYSILPPGWQLGHFGPTAVLAIHDSGRDASWPDSTYYVHTVCSTVLEPEPEPDVHKDLDSPSYPTLQGVLTTSEYITFVSLHAVGWAVLGVTLEPHAL